MQSPRCYITSYHDFNKNTCIRKKTISFTGILDFVIILMIKIISGSLSAWRIFFLALALIINTFLLNAQTNSVSDDYLKKVESYAEIYNGKIEMLYSPKQYNNFPYYFNSDFTEGEITYRKNIYSKQQVRLDLYKEQLIVVIPEKHYRVVVNPEGLERVSLYGKTFVWRVSSQKNKLKTGYYMVLFEGKDLGLFYKENFSPRGSERQDMITGRRISVFDFDKKTQYYVWYKDQYHSVKNKNSIKKLFPQYKKQIDRFLKENRLDFSNNKDYSLTLLSSYCEELMNNSR